MAVQCLYGRKTFEINGSSWSAFAAAGDQIDHSAGSLLTVECALRLPNHLNSANVVIGEIGEIERTAIDKTDRVAITGHSRCWESDLIR